MTVWSGFHLWIVFCTLVFVWNGFPLYRVRINQSANHIFVIKTDPPDQALLMALSYDFLYDENRLVLIMTYPQHFGRYTLETYTLIHICFQIWYVWSIRKCRKCEKNVKPFVISFTHTNTHTANARLSIVRITNLYYSKMPLPKSATTP